MCLANILKYIAARPILFILFFSPSLMGAPIHFSTYLLPTYPPVLNRAVVQGSFVVDVSGINGHISEVKITSHNIFTPAGRLQAPPPVMENGIINAIKRWEYEQYDRNVAINFQVVIEFRLADKQQASSRTSTCRYEISESDGRPVKIVIRRRIVLDRKSLTSDHARGSNPQCLAWQSVSSV